MKRVSFAFALERSWLFVCDPGNVRADARTECARLCIVCLVARSQRRCASTLAILLVHFCFLVMLGCVLGQLLKSMNQGLQKKEAVHVDVLTIADGDVGCVIVVRVDVGRWQ